MTKRLIALLVALAVIVSVLAAVYIWFQKKVPQATVEPKKEKIGLLERLDLLYSDKELGAVLDKENTQTVFRVFSPRAESVDLCLFDSPNIDLEDTSREPARVVAMQCDDQGVWETNLDGLLGGQYYLFRVAGPQGPGEGFDSGRYVGDPYARAVAHARNACIVIDAAATNQWFGGWSDDDYTQVKWDKTVIYEIHIRDFTMHPSSGVDSRLRGTYRAVSATEGLGTGIDHVEKLGANTLELMPVAEFANGTNSYHWGYAPSYSFAPEASYATAPLEGSQYYEFKQLVNDLHEAGIGVVLDVVYNHVDDPNIFRLLGRKYYFGLDQDHNCTNDSGCGNDLRTEAPMVRRLILDNVRYWMNEFHVDGFSFDLAELIDMETLDAVREAAREINPEVLLIAEPWSSRGSCKKILAGTGWQAWNDEFRDSVKRFVKSKGGRDAVRQAIEGRHESWTANPMQSVNYLESHDGLTLADELMTGTGEDNVIAREDMRRNILAATILFTSQGIPMLNAGQDFLRSKGGYSNTRDKGDRINAIYWNRRRARLSNMAMRYYRGLIMMRSSSPGASWRRPDVAPPDYYEWILPEDENLLGYFVNKHQEYNGASFLVLLNTSEKPVYFDVEFTSGRWLLIGDGMRIDPRGLAGSYFISSGLDKSVLVPGLSSRFFMRAPFD